MVVLRSLSFTAALVAVAGPAAGHVAIQPQTAVAGTYQVLRFAVGHGCGDQPTTALRIELPGGVQTARPQPKPGWRVSVAHDGKRPISVSWEGGPLPADQFDEFLILARLPAEMSNLTFPAIQSCGALETRWVEPTPSGGPRPRQPAPILRLTPPAATTTATTPTPSNAAGEHQH
jgi:uncharacterized protein YcnI